MPTTLYVAGDVIGCGVDFLKKQAFYTKNGAFQGKCVALRNKD